MSEVGGELARVEGLVVSAKGLKEVVKLGLLQLDQTQARKVLVSSLRTQQQRMHHHVTQSVTLTNISDMVEGDGMKKKIGRG